MSKGEGTLGNGLTLGVSGAQAGQGHRVLGAGPLVGATVACGGMVRETQQTERCEEEEQVGRPQSQQEVLRALLSRGANAGRVPAGGRGRGGRGRGGRGRGRGGGRGEGGEGRHVKVGLLYILKEIDLRAGRGTFY